MSDKKLLNENTIRRFMKLANVDTMTDNFISERYTKDDELEENNAEEEVVEEENTAEVEDPEDNPVKEEFELTTEEEEDAMAADDMGDDMEMDAEMGDMDAVDEGDADISLTEEEAQLLIDLGSRLEAAMGDAGEDDMGDMDDMDDMDDMGDDMDDMEADPADDDMEAEDEMAPGMRNTYMQEEIVNEVLKRVTQRIIREKMKRK